MQNQNKKMLMWAIGLTLFMLILVILELVIVRSIYPNDVEAFETCMANLLLITMFVFIIIFTIKFVQYHKIAQEYRRNKVEKAKKELTSDFKKVFIRNSGDISKDMFECKAKLDEDGKIVCEIFLNMKTTFESYEEFFYYFHFDENK